GRIAEAERLCRELGERVARLHTAEAQALFREAGVPVSRVNTLADVVADPLVAPRLVRVRDPRTGLTVVLPAPPVADPPPLAFALVCEELAWACAATATQYLDQALGGLPILLAGTEAQKAEYLPHLATGARLTAYSLSEPGAGSDAAGLRTTAVRKGDRYVLNGSKQWCPNGDHADVVVVFATVDPKLRAKGITAFLVKRGTPGFAVGKKEKKM